MVGAPGVVAGVTELDWPRLAAGADEVGGGHREGVGGAVGQPGHCLGGGRVVEGLGRLGHAGDIGRDHVAGDGLSAVGGGSGPGDRGRRVAVGGGADSRRTRNGGRGDGVGLGRGRPGAHDVDGRHREGIAGAVGQPGGRLGGGRVVEGLGGLGHTGLVGGDHVAGDGRPAVGGRCRPGDRGRGVAVGGRADGGCARNGGRSGRAGRRRLGAGADEVDGGHREGVGECRWSTRRPLRWWPSS